MKLNSALGVILFALAASGTALHAETVNATVEQINGNVYATDSAGKSKKLAAGDTISAGSLVHTNVDSSVKLKLVPGAITVVTPGTDVVLTKLEYSQASGVKTRTIKLNLKVGELLCSLAKHDGHSDFQVVTPNGTSKAIGTEWAITFTPSAGVTVATLNGTVEITLPNGHTATVPGGKITTSPDGSVTITGDLNDRQIAQLQDALKANDIGAVNYTITPVSNPANNSQNPSISPTF